MSKEKVVDPLPKDPAVRLMTLIKQFAAFELGRLSGLPSEYRWPLPAVRSEILKILDQHPDDKTARVATVLLLLMSSSLEECELLREFISKLEDKNHLIDMFLAVKRWRVEGRIC